MKKQQTLQRWFQSALVGLGLAASTTVGLAVTDQILGTFDADLTGYYVWGRGWGGLTTVEWDANGNPGGCLVSYGLLESTNSDTPVCVYAVNAGNPWWHPSGPFDISQYKAIEFDIKWDNDPANMPLNDFNYPKGDPGVWATTGLDIGSTPSATGDQAGYVTITNMPIPSAAAGAWVHVTVPIDPTKPGLGTSYGLFIRKWICNPPANPGEWQTGHVVTNTGNYKFYLDNVVLKGGDVLPPPTIDPLETPVQGMNFIAASGGQYDRQEIRTVGSNYAWYGASGPVSYSIDVAKIGENAPAPTGFTLFMHFVPGIPNPNNGDSDYSEPNVVMWTIGNSADGSAWSQLRYKTNSPNNNGILWGDGGFPGGVWNPTPAGTWTITFNQNTNIVITAPTGGTVTNILPPEVVDIFKNYSPNMQINIGGTPGQLSRLGQKAIITGVRISGTPGQAPVNSNFLGVPRDTNIWSIVASSPTYGVQQIMSDAAYWLSWSLPANRFNLQSSASLTSGWADLALSGYENGGKHIVLLKKSDLPSANAGFFRLMKREFTKLQVLMPGETAAPGTPTGKTGTPTPQAAFSGFNVIVNAVDNDWYPISGSSDTIHLTSSDAFGWLPADAAMANGTVTFVDCLFGTAAVSSTITASDVTDPTKLSGTGSPTPVN